MRICTTCKTERPIEEFHRKKGEERHRQCKFCKRVAIKAAYERNKAPYLERAKISNKRCQIKFRELSDRLKDRPCADCGQSFPPCVMDFDHREGEQKVHNISDFARRNAMAVFWKEIAKCDLVCANCHRIRTHNRRSTKETA